MSVPNVNNNTTLCEYKSLYTPKSVGMVNTGILCYFNSLIQLLGSCTSVVEYIIAKKHDNNFLITLSEMFREWIYNEHFTMMNDTRLFVDIVKMIRTIKGCEQYGSNQEDAGELMHRMIDLCGDKELESLFMNKVRCDLFCLKCRHMKQLQYDDVIMHIITAEHIIPFAIKSKTHTDLHPFNVYLRSNYSRCDILCEKCGGECIKISRLINVASIIMICLNKFYNKSVCDYPQVLTFDNAKTNTRYIYKLVATINHYGTQNFGHYVCRCLRKEGVVELNDQSARPCNMSPDMSSYILAYHFVHTESI